MIKLGIYFVALFECLFGIVLVLCLRTVWGWKATIGSDHFLLISVPMTMILIASLFAGFGLFCRDMSAWYLSQVVCGLVLLIGLLDLAWAFNGLPPRLTGIAELLGFTCILPSVFALILLNLPPIKSYIVQP